MSQIAILGFLMLLVSALLWVVTSVFASLAPKVRHWSAFWAAAISICLLSPVLGLALIFMPAPYPAHYFDVSLLHGPLQSLGNYLAPPDVNPQGQGASLWQKRFEFVGMFYLAGVCVFVARLVIGRLRVNRIAAQATGLRLPGLPVFWLTKRPVGAFAYTPLGRQKAAKIIISQVLLQTLSRGELADIVRHEYAHIQRRDDEWGLMLRFILALCWASPFAHALFSRWTMSAETQSDMAVNSGRSHGQRRAYAQTLLKALQITASRVLQYPVASFSTKHLRSEKMRIKHILTGEVPSFKSPCHRVSLSLVALSITVMGALIFSASTPIRAAADNSAKVSDVGLMVSGRLSAPYGNRYDPYKTGKPVKHNGIDVAAPLGTPIYAPADGVILAATDLYDGKPAYGKVVVFKTVDDTQTLLAHLDRYQVSKGQRIQKGTRIASVGNTGKSTGPHVHIETFKTGERVDPLTVWPMIK